MYVYWWYEAELELIKIGVGKHPISRMRDYSRAWNLKADEQSLVFHELPNDIDAQEIERFLHKRIMKAGHRMVRIGSANSQGTANEMFHTSKRDRGMIDEFLGKEMKKFISVMGAKFTMEPSTTENIITDQYSSMDSVIVGYYEKISPWPNTLPPRTAVPTRGNARPTAGPADSWAQYERGQSFDENGDYVEAVKWWLKSAEQGCAAAQHELGRAFWEGKGVSRDLVKAHVWLSLSWGAPIDRSCPVVFHSPSSGELRDALEEHMTTTQIDEAVVRAQEWIDKRTRNSGR